VEASPPPAPQGDEKAPRELCINASLTNDIIEFVCDKQLNDVELLRQAINCQVHKWPSIWDHATSPIEENETIAIDWQMQRAELRLNGYRTLLRLVLATDPLSDASQVALFTGYLGSMTSLTPNDANLITSGGDGAAARFSYNRTELTDGSIDSNNEQGNWIRKVWFDWRFQLFEWKLEHRYITLKYRIKIWHRFNYNVEGNKKFLPLGARLITFDMNKVKWLI